jgi:hypothetical protein
MCRAFFKPTAPTPKRAGAQRFCSRICSNRHTAQLKQFKRQNAQPLSAANSHQLDGGFAPPKMERFLDVKLAVALAYRRMVQERRIIPSDAGLYDHV